MLIKTEAMSMIKSHQSRNDCVTTEFEANHFWNRLTQHNYGNINKTEWAQFTLKIDVVEACLMREMTRCCVAPTMLSPLMARMTSPVRRAPLSDAGESEFTCVRKRKSK